MDMAATHINAHFLPPVLPQGKKIRTHRNGVTFFTMRRQNLSSSIKFLIDSEFRGAMYNGAQRKEPKIEPEFPYTLNQQGHNCCFVFHLQS